MSANIQSTSLVPGPFVASLESSVKMEQTALILELFKQGKEFYGKSFDISRNYFLGALFSQFAQIGFVPATAAPQVGIECLDFVDQHLLTSDRTSLVERVKENNFTPEQRLFLAQTLRWLGHCYQNIDRYKGVSQENNKRFEFLYGAAEELLKLDHSEATHLELAELYYNTGFFMHLKKNPGDYLGACETYEKALALNPSEAMMARVRNMRSILREKAGVVMTPESYRNDVLDPYLALSAEEQNPFLVAMYYHNYAKIVLCQKEPDLTVANEALKHTVDYMDKAERGEAELHGYFPGFYRTVAELRLLQKQPEAAAEAIQKSLEHANRNPGSYNQ